MNREHNKITKLNNLYMLNTKQHESQHIDNQLRNHSKHQNNPSKNRFYLSLQNNLMQLFNTSLINQIITTSNINNNTPIKSKIISQSIASTQNQVENQNFEIHKNILKYNNILNHQHKIIYTKQQQILKNKNLHKQIQHFINDVITNYVHEATAENFAKN